MRIVMTMKWDGVTSEQYEQIRKRVNWEGNIPKGAVFHVAGFEDKALRVTDIWESVDDFNHFVEHRLMPATTEAGIQTQPQVATFPVHAIFNPALSN